MARSSSAPGLRANSGRASSGGPYANTILTHLDGLTVDRLQLKRVEFEVEQELEAPGQAISHIFFIESGVGSMTTVFRNGREVEVGMFGYESVVGASALMGTRRSLNRIYVQVAGFGYASPVAAALREFKRNETFHDLALRYVQAQLTQSAQNAACNAVHSNEQRLARWLLICCDRTGKTSFHFSQEFLSYMLGSTRSTVNLTESSLRAKGLIEHRRGVIQILNVKGLEEQACECYRVVRDHLENYAEFDTGFVV